MRIPLLISVMAFWILLRIPAPAFLEAHADQPEPDSSDQGPPGLAFLSDTQAPLFLETILLPVHQNQEATRILFDAIRRRHPAGLFLLGDLVSLGFHGRAWEDIDREVAALRQDSIPVDGILGNHEVMLLSGSGEENFQALFPDHVRTGYLRTFDSIAVVLLNSNFANLSGEEERHQQVWYARTLDSLQAAPAIRAMIVCCHHSPFSNSKVVGSAGEVRRVFVPPFVATPKCRLFLSGHAHTLEHFRERGKDFLVTGGGGGLNHPLYEGADRQWNDLWSSDRPAFHYLRVQRWGDSLLVGVYGLEEGSTAVRRKGEVIIPGEQARGR